MKTWTFAKSSTALRHAQDGEFEFEYDMRDGENEVRYQTPNGNWRNGTVVINDTFENTRYAINLELARLGFAMERAKKEGAI